MDLSVVIPAYNETRRIKGALSEVAEFFDQSRLSWEALVIDDGSLDRTAEAAKEWASAQGQKLRVISIPHQGKGAAVAEGVRVAKGRWILMTDADLSTPLTEWPKLARALDEGAALAIGSRQAPGSEVIQYQPWLRQRMGFLFGGLVRRLFPIKVMDSQCGFKAFEARAAKDIFGELKTRGFCFDVEVILRARARGLKVVEVPVIWRHDPDSRVRLLRDWPGVVKELWLIRAELMDSMGKAKGGP